MNRREVLWSLGAMFVAGSPLARAQERCAMPNQLTGMVSCEVGIPSWQGNIMLRQQPYLSQWCWAACMEMIFAYYGYRVPMARIVQEVYGQQVNLPAMSWTIVQQLSRVWKDDNNRQFSSQCDVLWDADVGYAKTRPDQIASQYLHERMPLIIGTLGHAMVLTALSYEKHVYTGDGYVTSAIVRDPYPGRGGRRVLSGQEWFGTRFLVAPIVTRA